MWKHNGKHPKKHSVKKIQKYEYEVIIIKTSKVVMHSRFNCKITGVFFTYLQFLAFKVNDINSLVQFSREESSISSEKLRN